ncbi:MAG: hypothetical protein GTO13_14215, partial [Proteobacteria bacterium]|nr:hypothetical protein [Pseudomonadota bacterium]
MKTLGHIFLVAVTVSSFALSTYAKGDYAKRKLLVTEQVLVEYVEDRLNQLEVREDLSEEEAVELEFIHHNRHNLQGLADFYGMKIEEEIPKRISAREEPPARKIQEEKREEIPQSRPVAPDTVKSEEASLPMEATRIETTELDESLGDPAPNEEMAKARTGERMEGSVA